MFFRNTSPLLNTDDGEINNIALARRSRADVEYKIKL